jgi:hypothetical protein
VYRQTTLSDFIESSAQEFREQWQDNGPGPLHAPRAIGGTALIDWWAGPERKPLAELVDCCLFIAVDEGT